MKKNLKTVLQFAAESPFTEAQLRWFIFNAASNGIADAKALLKVGRRVYIDVDAFEAWLDSCGRGSSRK